MPTSSRYVYSVVEDFRALQVPSNMETTELEGVSHQEHDQLRSKIRTLEEELQRNQQEHEHACTNLNEMLEEQKGVTRSKDRQIESMVCKHTYIYTCTHTSIHIHTSILPISLCSYTYN